MFVSPRANSIFLQNYTGQQGLKPALHWEKHLREDRKRGYVDTQFSSQMEAFHVVNTEMPTQQTIGASTPLLFMHILHAILHKNGWRELQNSSWVGSLSETYLIDLQAHSISLQKYTGQKTVCGVLYISQHLLSSFSGSLVFGEFAVLNKW